MSNIYSDRNTKTGTDTNMFVSVLANSEKLKDQKDLVHYGDEFQNDVGEKIESCMDENEGQQNVNEYHNDNNDHADEQRPQQEMVVAQQEPPKAVIKEDLDEYDEATPIRKKLLKLDMMRKLTELVNKGVKLSQNYNMESDYKTMKYEWELHTCIREKHNVVTFLQDGALSGVDSLEALNKKYGKFGLELDGWSDRVNSKTDQLYDAFGGLYDKWGGPGKRIPPELMLMGIFGFSAVKTHLVNTAINSTPSIEDKLKSDPKSLDDIRRQALGNTIAEQDSKKAPEFQEKIKQQYERAIESARDYQQLREEEEEHKMMQEQQMRQPVMRPPMRRQQTAQQGVQNSQQTMMPPKFPLLQRQQEAIAQNLTPSMMTGEQFKKFRETEIQEQKKAFEKRLSEQKRAINKKKRDEVSHHSSASSVVVMNPDFDEILKEAETLSNASKPKKRKGRKGKKTEDSIKIDLDE